MANTIRAARNSFSEGLVMDLSPDNTPNLVLTSALNATLVTFNGNELLLQNDMGNGRVETARLPEGYIPVGTCEFGDIIYIVSYNPLTNKSLIGCFPSPERNISSVETGSTNQCLSSWDFQVPASPGQANSQPNGELIASSVKKILYNNKLNPGDKFIIYDKQGTIFNSKNMITDIGNKSHQYGAFPKYLKVHVIAIEDSGKINFLDSTLRWYENGNMSSNDYFITTSHDDNGKQVPDIDSYRSLLSSGYSVFLSKISGKLALLIELEKITGFSCTYSVFGKEESTELESNEAPSEPSEEPSSNHIVTKGYEIYWNVSWETDDPNINPKYIVLTKSKWSGKDSSKVGKWYSWIPGDNNTYKLDEGNTMADPPAAYYKEVNGVKLLQDSLANYNYWEITKGNNTIGYLATDGDYNTFVEQTSYDSILQKFISKLIEAKPYYADVALTKLNVVREGAYQTPVIGDYYINASRIEYKKTVDLYNNETIETKIYTLTPSDGKYQEIESVSIPDVIVNNYFHQPIYLQYHKFLIPIRQEIEEASENPEEEPKVHIVKPDTTNLIYNYEITPAMPYGLLSEFAIEGYIDFSKIGTGAIDLNTWKYFVGENSCNLTIGMDAYVEDNMGIEEVVLEFYDNQGMAAAYHIMNKESYSGQFTEVIPLNGVANTYKLLNKDALGNPHVHLGTIANEGDSPVYKFDEHTNKIIETEWSDSETTYLDDCGIIYSNMLYLVRIVIKYCPKNAIGEFDTSATSSYKYFHRWIWTTTMFNQYYHSVTDFDTIPLVLTLDVAPQYAVTLDYYYGSFGYNSTNTESYRSENGYSYLSANVQVISATDDINAEELDNPDEPGGGGGGEPGGGEEELPPLTSPTVSSSLNSFTAEYNRIITAVDLNKVAFTLTENDESRELQYGTDYTIVSSEGSMVFRVVFFELSNSFSIRVQLQRGAISFKGDESNPVVDVTFGFINGVPQ